MEFKGTKGKWEATILNDGSGLHAIFSAKSNTLISRTCYMPFSKANALIISKAPEMLEMLKRIYNGNHFQYPELGKEIQQLIKEATEI